MIAIVNITPDPKPTGPHTYSLRINRDEVCQFTHRRELPLSECLKEAAVAAKKSEMDVIIRFCEAMIK